MSEKIDNIEIILPELNNNDDISSLNFTKEELLKKSLNIIKEIAIKKNISLYNNGKKKIKKDLINEIIS